MGKNCCQLVTRVVLMILAIVVIILSIVSEVTPLFQMTIVNDEYGYGPDIKDFNYFTSCHENDYHCASVDSVIAAILSIVAIALAFVDLILLIPLLVTQVSWNCGGQRDVSCERGVGIAHLVFVILYMCATVVAFALTARAAKSLLDRNHVGEIFPNKDRVASHKLMGAFFTSLFACVAAVVAFVLSAIPAAFGVEYGRAGCAGYQVDNDKYALAQARDVARHRSYDRRPTERAGVTREDVPAKHPLSRNLPSAPLSGDPVARP